MVSYDVKNAKGKGWESQRRVTNEKVGRNTSEAISWVLVPQEPVFLALSSLRGERSTAFEASLFLL